MEHLVQTVQTSEGEPIMTQLSKPNNPSKPAAPNNLFRPSSIDRNDNMLTYTVNFFPFHRFGHEWRFIHFQQSCVMTKKGLLNNLSDDLCFVFLPRDTSSRPFKLHWAYNNIPTEIEWNKMSEDSTFFLEYRISPMCSGGGRVCVIEVDRAIFVPAHA